MIAIPRAAARSRQRTRRTLTKDSFPTLSLVGIGEIVSSK